jgi:AraC-like DNA-binding protein
MDETCVWLEKLMAWVDRCGPPRIPYAGRSPSGYSNPPAPHIEIVLVLDTDVKGLRLGDRVVDYPPRHIVIHNVHLGAKTPVMRPMDAWCAMLDVGGEGEFKSVEDTPLFCTSPLDRLEETVEAFARLASRCTRFGSGPRNYLAATPQFNPAHDSGAANAQSVLVKAALLELFATLLQELAGDAADDSTRRPVAIERALEFISLHYRTSGLTLSDVSAAAGLSEDHFGRAFRESVGVTPMRHLRRMRINQSRYLLEHTSLLVEEIAAEVGFTDPFHFSRVFKSETGVSPSGWRLGGDRR